ncbi:beta-ketoacyl synthase chain length factor [Aquabacterium sp.]|uniref:beta-ketoacyl synthase chain length factor n=1 Tax=Aquabacterium sp. TaxID=1872578 RepID=UPI002C4CD961|nr:beta-ketoacyl synthase chain length factor [Aquabacterium sp.]HSW03459.1 beta-ketoacyl synthase chain length factor [Aquabacterium sp.]
MRTLHIDGIAFWAPTLPGWDIARAAMRDEAAPLEPPARRPSPLLLPAAERRRAPDTVALALEVASAAVSASGHDPKTLPSVFVSAHGDLAINDHLCSMLASTPTQISPTKFHNSVHNAGAGYWTMGVGCHEASTALTAFEHSFANGLLAAATQCAADERPVLLVGYDVQVVGALASVTRSESLLAVALVLSPKVGGSSVAGFDWALQPAEPGAPAAPLVSPAAQALAGNALADALPFFEALARGYMDWQCLPLSSRQSLALRLRS